MGDQKLIALASAITAFFRFLRQPSRPNAPRPLANSGSAVGRGVSATDHAAVF